MPAAHGPSERARACSSRSTPSASVAATERRRLRQVAGCARPGPLARVLEPLALGRFFCAVVSHVRTRQRNARVRRDRQLRARRRRTGDDAGHDLDAAPRAPAGRPAAGPACRPPSGSARRGARDQAQRDLDEQQHDHDRRRQPDAGDEDQRRACGPRSRRSAPDRRRQRRSAAPRRTPPAPAAAVVPVDPEERDHRQVAVERRERRCCARRSADRRSRRTRTQSGSRRGGRRARPPAISDRDAPAPSARPIGDLARHDQRQPTRRRPIGGIGDRRHQRQRDAAPSARSDAAPATYAPPKHRRRASPARPAAPAAGRTARAADRSDHRTNSGSRCDHCAAKPVITRSIHGNVSAKTTKIAGGARNERRARCPEST